MLPLLGSKGSGHLSGGLDYPRSARAWSPTSPKARSCGWNSLFGACVALAVVSILMGVFELMTGAWGSQLSQLQQHFRSTSTAKGSDVLVMYIFSNTDPLYLDNLKFFLREGAHADDGCEYIFVVNRSPEEEIIDLPPLPPNARYVLHNNECYDWGTFGWALTTQGINVDKYSYFVFMNSSVRGPFVPSYIKGHVHWADILFSKITDEVKLVGPTINCEGSPQGGNPANAWRKNPHVQSYVVATDRIGMQILLDDQNVFKCYSNMWDTIYHSELGSSAAILDAGYNIDSLMVRYQGVDWRDQNNWGCNDERNPYGAHYLDGGSLETMEVMFVKVKQRLIDLDWSYPYAATQYDKWYLALDEGVPDIKPNKYVTDGARYKLPGVFAAAVQGMDCFDCPFYRTQNPDLPQMWSCMQLFDHYVNNGQFEGRNFQLVCEIPAADLLPFSPEPGIMSVLPHVSPERVTELLIASGAPVDTPTPRVTAAQEVAAASLASSAANSLSQESGASPLAKKHGGKKRRGSKVTSSGSKVTSSAQDWALDIDEQPLATVGDGSHFDGSGWRGGAETVESLEQLNESSGKHQEPRISGDSAGQLWPIEDRFAADAQAARAGLRSSHGSSSHSTVASSASDSSSHSSDDSSADSATASSTSSHPRKLTTVLMQDDAPRTEAPLVEASEELGDILTTATSATRRVATGDPMHESDDATETKSGRHLMSAASEGSEKWLNSQQSYAGRQYLSTATQTLLLR